MMRRTRLTTLLALIFILSVPQSAAASTWLSAKQLSGATRAEARPSAIAMVTGTVGIAYSEEQPDHTWRVWFRRSTDGGATWLTPVRVSSSAGNANAASLASAGTTFDIVWREQDTSGDQRLWYARSIDGGVTWKAKKILSPAGASASYPRLARDAAERVAVIWIGQASGEPARVYTRVSTDGGATFASRVSLATVIPFEAYPNIAIGNFGKIHAAYNLSGQVLYRRSTDDGATWTMPGLIADNIESASPPAMAANRHEPDDRLHPCRHRHRRPLGAIPAEHQQRNLVRFRAGAGHEGCQ